MSCQRLPETNSILPPKYKQSIIIASNMCQRIIRHHTLCGHTDEFLIIGCLGYKLRTELYHRRGFWSKLIRPKPSCKVKHIRESRDSFCHCCTRQRADEDYPFDNYGLPLPFCEYNADFTPKRWFWKIVPNSDSIGQDSTMPEMRTNMVDLRIDREQWSHVRDHIIPPRPGPPPNKPLPPVPTSSQFVHVHVQQAPVPQGRPRNASAQNIRRKPVAEQLNEDCQRHKGHLEDGPPEPFSPVSAPRDRRKERPLLLMLEGGREVPEIAFFSEPDLGRSLTFSFLQNDESSTQEAQTPARRVRHGGNGTNQPREKPEKFQYSPISPLTPKAISPTICQVNGPNLHAQTTNGRYEHPHSVNGDMAYISPNLEQKIDDVQKSWNASARQSEERYGMRIGAEKEPIKQKGTNGKRKREEGFDLIM